MYFTTPLPLRPRLIETLPGAIVLSPIIMSNQFRMISFSMLKSVPHALNFHAL